MFITSLSNFINGLTKPEMEKLLSQLNLANDEEEILKYLGQRKSYIEISYLSNVSVATIGRRIAIIKKKLVKLGYLKEGDK